MGGLIAVGDLDADGMHDLLWSNAGDGVWVKHSTTLGWTRLTPAAARDMDAGNMRGGMNPWSSARKEGYIKLPGPIGGYMEGPGSVTEYEDLSDEGPGGWNFVFSEETNLIPKELIPGNSTRIPGPEEPGFHCIEQANLYIQGTQTKKREK
jgi:hypothetical protein